MKQFVVIPEKRVIVLSEGALAPSEYKHLKHHVLASGKVVLPHNDVNYMALRHVLSDLPAPVETYYNFPRPNGWDVMGHQPGAVAHICYNQRCFLWSDIGTGKTAMASWAMDWMMRHQGIKRVLILSPKSTLNKVWFREVKRIAPRYKTKVLIAPLTRARAYLKDHTPEVIITNHDSTRYMKDELIQFNPDLIIVDEHTAYGNKKAARTKGLMSLIGPTTRLVMMSGEPMPDTPMNLHGPAMMVAPRDVPDTKTGWQIATMMPIKSGKWIPMPGIEEVIVRMLEGKALYIKRDDCMDLPPTTYDVVRCDPSAQLKKTIKDLKKEAIAEFDETDKFVLAANELSYMTKILQSACGSVRGSDAEGSPTSITIDVESKFEALDDTLMGSRGPVIVYVPYRDVLDLVSTWLTRKKISHHIVHGGIGQRARDAAFTAVEENKTKVLLAVPDAMAHGITLVQSNTIVWWGMPRSNGTYGQANGRITRPGQNRKTFIRMLISCKLETEVYRRLRQKQKVQGALLDLVDKN
jgi:SNF2 family DNA or RNA helicase